jgi:hypothetical protein
LATSVKSACNVLGCRRARNRCKILSRKVHCLHICGRQNIRQLRNPLNILEFARLNIVPQNIAFLPGNGLKYPYFIYFFKKHTFASC